MSIGFLSDKKTWTTTFSTTFSTSSSFTTTFNTSNSTTTTYNTSKSTTTTFNTSRTTSVTNQTYQNGPTGTNSYTWFAFRPNYANGYSNTAIWAGTAYTGGNTYVINVGGYSYYALQNNGQLRLSNNYWGNYANSSSSNNYYRYNIRRYYNVTNNYTTTFSTSRSTTTTFSTSRSTTTTFSTSKSTTTTVNTSRSTDRITSFYA